MIRLDICTKIFIVEEKQSSIECAGPIGDRGWWRRSHFAKKRICLRTWKISFTFEDKGIKKRKEKKENKKGKGEKK